MAIDSRSCPVVHFKFTSPSAPAILGHKLSRLSPFDSLLQRLDTAGLASRGPESIVDIAFFTRGRALEVAPVPNKRMGFGAFSLFRRDLVGGSLFDYKNLLGFLGATPDSVVVLEDLDN